MHLYLKHIRIKLMLFIIYDETSRAHAKTIRHASPVVTYVNAGLFQNMESLCVVSVLKKIHMLKTISVYLSENIPLPNRDIPCIEEAPVHLYVNVLLLVSLLLLNSQNWKIQSHPILMISSFALFDPSTFQGI